MSEEILKGHQIHRSKIMIKIIFYFLEKIVNLKKKKKYINMHQKDFEKSLTINLISHSNNFFVQI